MGGFFVWVFFLFLKFEFKLSSCVDSKIGVYILFIALYAMTYVYDPTSINQFLFQDMSVVSIILLKFYLRHAVIIPCTYIL